MTITVRCAECRRPVRRFAHERGDYAACWACEFGCAPNGDPELRAGAMRERRFHLGEAPAQTVRALLRRQAA